MINDYKKSKAQLDREARLGDKAFIRFREVILDEYETFSSTCSRFSFKWLVLVVGIFIELLCDIRNNIYMLKPNRYEPSIDTYDPQGDFNDR